MHSTVHAGGVNAVTYFPDGNRIASASDDKTVKITKAVSGEVEMELLGHEKEVKRIAISSDGKRLASGGLDRTMRVWDASTGTCEHTVDCGSNVLGLDFGPDGKCIAAGLENGEVKIFNVDSAEFEATLSGKEVFVNQSSYAKDCQGVLCIKFSNDGAYMAVGDQDTTIRIYDGKTFALLSTLQHSTETECYVRSVAWNRDSTKLASAGGDQKVHIFAVGADGSFEYEKGGNLNLSGHMDHVYTVAFKPDDPNILVSGAGDKKVIVWKMDGNVLWCGGDLTMTGHADSVMCLAFKPDDPNFLVTGSQDQTIKVWNLATGQCTSN
jgi:WD40 repeat protein